MNDHYEDAIDILQNLLDKQEIKTACLVFSVLIGSGTSRKYIEKKLNSKILKHINAIEKKVKEIHALNLNEEQLQNTLKRQIEEIEKLPILDRHKRTFVRAAFFHARPENDPKKLHSKLCDYFLIDPSIPKELIYIEP